jgi:hypothetical protein
MVNPTGPSPTELTALRAASVGRQAAAAAAPVTPQTTRQAIRQAVGNVLEHLSSGPRVPAQFVATSAHVPTQEVELPSLLAPALQAQYEQATIAELPAAPSALALGAAAILAPALAPEPRDSDPRESAACAAAAQEATIAMSDEHVTAPAPAGNFLTRFFSACAARLFGGSSRVQPTVEQDPLTMADLLNKQTATDMKISKFLFGRVGYSLCSYFTSWTSDTTKALISRIQTLESAAKDAPKLQAAAERVAKAITNVAVHPDAIISEQETLVPASLNRGGKAANTELKASLAELHKLAEAFVVKYKPSVPVDTQGTTAVVDQNLLLTNPIAYTAAYETVLLNLIQNSPTGKDVTVQDLQTLINRNLLTDTIISKDVDTFIAEYKKELGKKGGVLPSVDNLIQKLTTALAMEGNDAAFINNLILKKLVSSDIRTAIQAILQDGAQSPELQDLDTKETTIRAKIKGFAEELNTKIEERETARVAYLDAFVADVEQSDRAAKASGQRGLTEPQRLFLALCKTQQYDMAKCQPLMSMLTSPAPKTIEEALTFLEGKTRVAALPRDGSAQSPEAIASYKTRQDAQQAFQRAAQNLADKCQTMFGAPTAEHKDLPTLEELKALIEKDSAGTVVGFLTRTHGDHETGGFDEKVIAFTAGDLHNQVEQLLNIPAERQAAQLAFAKKRDDACQDLALISGSEQGLQRVQADIQDTLKDAHIFAGLNLRQPPELRRGSFETASLGRRESVAAGATSPWGEDSRADLSGILPTGRLSPIPEEAPTSPALSARSLDAAAAPRPMEAALEALEAAPAQPEASVVAGARRISSNPSIRALEESVNGLVQETQQGIRRIPI